MSRLSNHRAPNESRPLCQLRFTPASDGAVHPGRAICKNGPPNGYRPQRRATMDSVYRVTEVIGTSSDSWEAAANSAVETAARTVRDLRVAERHASTSRSRTARSRATASGSTSSSTSPATSSRPPVFKRSRRRRQRYSRIRSLSRQSFRAATIECRGGGPDAAQRSRRVSSRDVSEFCGAGGVRDVTTGGMSGRRRSLRDDGATCVADLSAPRTPTRPGLSGGWEQPTVPQPSSGSARTRATFVRATHGIVDDGRP